MYEVSVEHSFSASHSIRLADGSLEPSHEHLWHVVAYLRSDHLEQPRGIVIDFLDVLEAIKSVACELQGRDISALEAFGEDGASAERVAEFFATELISRLDDRGKLYKVGITEAPGCGAAYYPQGNGA